MAAPSLRSSLDLIQDATFVHQDELLLFSQLDIASPHMPPHQYLVDSEDEIDDESDDERDDYLDVNDLISDEDDSDGDDDDDDVVIDKSILNNRPPSRLGRPLSPSPRKSMRISKRHGPSVARIKMENAFLKNQNNKLAQELEQCRLTIQALKNIVGQKDIGLQNVRTENQQAILQIKVLEAMLLSKHAKDGSIIVRSGDGDIPLNLSNLPFLQDEILKKEISQKPVSQESDSPIPAPQQSTQPPLQTAADAAESSDDDLLPPPLPPKRPNRHIRRWSMDFGPNNRLGYDEVSLNISSHLTSFDDHHNNHNHNNNNDDNNNLNNNNNNNKDNNNTILSHSTSVTPTSSTLTPSKDRDLQRSVPQIPRILRRRTGDIIQSLASCRPSSTKNGYDYSPPCTPSSDSSENDESVIDEKSGHRRRKSTQRNLSRFRKIFLR